MNPQPEATGPHSSEDTSHLNLSKLIASNESGLRAEADTSVTAFVARTAAEVTHHSGKPVLQPRNGGGISPQTMLGVVSYCYSKGIYGSEDIERKLLLDPAVQAACQGDVPRPEAIRRFRRLNREAIQTTLEKALRYTRKRIRNLLVPENPFQQNTPPVATGPVEETQTLARREASDRIDKATFIDGMSM